MEDTHLQAGYEKQSKKKGSTTRHQTYRPGDRYDPCPRGVSDAKMLSPLVWNGNRQYEAVRGHPSRMVRNAVRQSFTMYACRMGRIRDGPTWCVSSRDVNGARYPSSRATIVSRAVYPS